MYYADKSAQIIRSSLSDSAKVYKDTYLADCELGDSVTIGDRSRLTNCALDEHVVIQRGNLVFSSTFGRYTSTMHNTTIFHAAIGAFTAISWNVSIGGAHHEYRNPTIHGFISCADFGMLNGEDWNVLPGGGCSGKNGFDLYSKECVIGNDVWIAAGACVNRGCHIGDGAVVGANSVVTHDVPPYTIVAGCPARPIKKRFSEEVIIRLLAAQWWKLPERILKENIHLFSQEMDESNLEVIERLCMQ